MQHTRTTAHGPRIPGCSSRWLINLNLQLKLRHAFVTWENEARRIVRAELVRRGLTYQRLAERLQKMGIAETERSIANKMSRGTFSFVFALQCLKAAGLNEVTFEIEPSKRRAE